MTKPTIDILNKILQGEQMAIDLYETFLDKIREKKLYAELQAIQMDHLKHKQALVKRIQELDGIAEPHKTGFQGQLVQIISKAKTTIYADYGDMLKDLYNGELMGIDKTQQIIYNQLSEQDLEMVQDILSDEIDHVHRLKELVSKLEEQKVH